LVTSLSFGDATVSLISPTNISSEICWALLDDVHGLKTFSLHLKEIGEVLFVLVK